MQGGVTYNGVLNDEGELEPSGRPLSVSSSKGRVRRTMGLRRLGVASRPEAEVAPLVADAKTYTYGMAQAAEAERGNTRRANRNNVAGHEAERMELYDSHVYKAAEQKASPPGSQGDERPPSKRTRSQP